MKKLLPLTLLGALLPGLAFAAYNDVSLRTSAVISAGGQTFNVEGDSNVVESITVTANDFSFVLQPNSTLKVSSPSRNQLETNADRQYITDLACDETNSYIKLSSSASSNITITLSPKGGTCPIGAGGGGSNAGTSSSGGGSSSVSVAPQAPAATISALMAQIALLQARIAAFVNGTPAPSYPVASVPPGLIISTLASGSRGGEVKLLQQFLNTHGFQVSSSGAGSPGQETETLGGLTVKAVQKFQEKYGIAKVGDSGYGVVGPKTRAKIKELSGN